MFFDGMTALDAVRHYKASEECAKARQRGRAVVLVDEIMPLLCRSRKEELAVLRSELGISELIWDRRKTMTGILIELRQALLRIDEQPRRE